MLREGVATTHPALSTDQTSSLQPIPRINLAREYETFVAHGTLGAAGRELQAVAKSLSTALNEIFHRGLPLEKKLEELEKLRIFHRSELKDHLASIGLSTVIIATVLTSTEIPITALIVTATCAIASATLTIKCIINAIREHKILKALESLPRTQNTQSTRVSSANTKGNLRNM